LKRKTISTREKVGFRKLVWLTRLGSKVGHAKNEESVKKKVRKIEEFGGIKADLKQFNLQKVVFI
jgi:hypothetical protein